MPNVNKPTGSLEDTELLHGTNGGDGAPLTPNQVAVIARPKLKRKVGLSRFPLSDTGNAEAFAATFGHAFRYDHSLKRWFYFSGHSFRLDEIGAAQEATKQCIRERLRQALDEKDTEARKQGVQWALKSENLSRRKALLELAESLPTLSVGGNEWDTDPTLLATPNGVFNLLTNSFRDGEVTDLITQRTGVEFVKNASCPRWIRFIQEVTQDDDELARYLHRAAGYAISGDMTEQKFFLLTGSGANGKSTFLNALQHVLGDYAYSAPQSAFFGRGSKIGEDIKCLDGRRLVIATEPPTGSKLNQSRLKAFSGGDVVNARNMYSHPCQFRPVSKIFLATNELPPVAESNQAWWRRVQRVPFNGIFTGSHCDAHLLTELKMEASGILNWLIEGWNQWQEHRLEEPKAVTAANTEYETDSDPILEFMEVCLTPDPNAKTRAKALFETYDQWATNEGLHKDERLTSNGFNRKIKRWFERGKDPKSRQSIYLGVRLRSDG